MQAEPARLELAPLLAVQPRHGYTPDFLAPPPQSPLVTIDQELERVRSTPAEVVAVELGRSLAQREGAPPAALRALLADLDPASASRATPWRWVGAARGHRDLAGEGLVLMPSALSGRGGAGA